MIVGEGSGATRAEMKKEILEEIHQEERRRKLVNCLGCLFLKLLLILIPIVLVAVMVAQSGFFNVPLLSKWLYRPSEPQRLVKPLVGYDGEQVMKAAMARASYNGAVGVLTVSLSEQELTTLANSALTNPSADSAEGAMPAFKSVQMTVGEPGIELFAVAPRPERDVTIKILFHPSIDNEGKLDLAVTKMEFGSLNVPKVLVEMASKTLSSQLSREFASVISGAGKLEAVRTGEKTLYLDFRPELKLELPKLNLPTK